MTHSYNEILIGTYDLLMGVISSYLERYSKIFSDKASRVCL